MLRKDIEKPNIKRENALAVLKLWEDNLKLKNAFNERKVYLKKNNELKNHD